MEVGNGRVNDKGMGGRRPVSEVIVLVRSQRTEVPTRRCIKQPDGTDPQL